MEAELLDADGKLLAKLSTSALPTTMPERANLVESA